MSGAGEHLWVINSTTDSAGRCTHIDDQWLAFTGQSRSDALGSGWFNAIHPQDRPKTVETLRATWEDRAALRTEFRIRRSDGVYRSVLMVGSPRHDEKGAFIGYVGSIVDVHDWRAFEETLRASEQKLRFAHDRLTATLRAYPVVLFEQDGPRLRYVWIHNPDVMTAAENVVGKTDHDLFEREGDADAVTAVKRAALATGEPAREEVEIQVRGELRWFDLRVEPRSTRGATDGVLCTLTDVTQRKRTEEALLSADKRKDEFLAILGHELRNPLAPILAGVEILRRAQRADAEAPERAVIAVMKRQVGHLVRLVDDLLEVSRINSDKIVLRREPAEVAAIIRDALDIARPAIEKNGHEVELRIAPEPLRLFGDPTRLAQVVTNILNNAARYTPFGGRIEIEAERAAAEAVIRVRDNGVGMAPETLPRIFDLFSQVEPGKAAGLGVGLALAKKLVELHGGVIEAMSAGAGKGSEFSVRLPLDDASVPANTPNGQAPARIEPSRVLVVDDDQDVADSLAMLMESLGAETRTAHDGGAAVEAAAAFEPEIALIDIRMNGIDGYETARLLRERLGERTPLLVALTGLGQDRDREAALEAGFDLHLTKPVSADALERVLVSGRR
jgi:PAS domain S-box-containing protein